MEAFGHMNRKVDRIVFFFRSTFSLMFLSRFYLYSNLIERICLERRKVHSGASELEFFLKILIVSAAKKRIVSSH
jgi:hypothetical protein